MVNLNHHHAACNARKVIGFMAFSYATITDLDHIRFFRRPYPEFRTPVSDVLTTLFSPYGVVKRDSAFVKTGISG
jgi:hypothetical protein